MRLSREELLRMYPSWNEERHDIVKAFYGDIPLIEWNEEEYKRYCKLEGTLSNIEAVDAYIWTQNGDYSIYRTLIGEVYLTVGGKVMAGTIHLKYRGVTFTLSINLMYGMRALDILKLSGEKVKGFSNKGGTGSPSNKYRTEELDTEVIEKLFVTDLRDYGSSVRKFMRECIKLYEVDRVNHIMEKCFSM